LFSIFFFHHPRNPDVLCPSKRPGWQSKKPTSFFIGGKSARGDSGRMIAARDAKGKVLASYGRHFRFERSATQWNPTRFEYACTPRGKIVRQSLLMLKETVAIK
jgi:hypothetical protein